MKFTWGTAIFIVIVMFIMLVVAFFIYMSSLDIKLVEDNYYEKELVYQEKIDKMRNTERLPGKIVAAVENEEIVIRFPEVVNDGTTEGKVTFYRPSDPGRDFFIPLALNDSAELRFNAGGLDRGKWTLKMDWVTGGTAYYHEAGIFLPE